MRERVCERECVYVCVCVCVCACVLRFPVTQITALLKSVNGVLFTGGGASLHAGSVYFAAIETVFAYVISANANGTLRSRVCIC